MAAPLAQELPAARDAAAIGDNSVMADRVFAMLTDQVEFRRQFARGEAGLWDPHSGLGTPLLGGSITGPLYPLNLVALILPVDIAAGWLALASLVVGGLGMMLWLRGLGLAPAAVLIGTLAFQCSGWALCNLHFPAKVDAAVWLPWSLWAIDGIALGRRRAGPILAVAVMSSALAGWLPIAVFSVGLLVAWIGWRALRPTEGQPHPPIRFAAAAIGWLLVGGLAAAIQWAPTLEASQCSIRQGQAAEQITGQAMPIGMAASLVLPGIFGTPREHAAGPDPLAAWVAGSADAHQVLTSNVLEWNAFAGLTVVMVALVGIFARPRRALWPATMLLLTWAFAQAWPIMREAYRIPGLNVAGPQRVLALQWTLWPWLAALGVDALVHARARWIARVLGLLVAGLAAAWWLGFDRAQWSTRFVDSIAQKFGVASADVADLFPPDAIERAAGRIDALTSHTFVVAMTILAALWWATRHRAVTDGARSLLAQWAPLSLVLIIEALLAAAPYVQPRTLKGDLLPETPLIRTIREAAGDGRVVRYDPTPGTYPAEAATLARPNLLQAYGVRDLTPYHAFTPRSLIELVTAIDPDSRYLSTISRITRREVLAHPVLDLARVTCVLSRRSLDHPRLRLEAQDHGVYVYRRTGSPARVHFAARWVVARDANELLARITRGAIHPLEEVILLQAPAPGTNTGSAHQGDIGRVRVLDPDASDRLEVEVDHQGGAWLVFHDQYAPGWRATVDGRPAELLRANYALRAVFVPPGRHRVSTWYSPWSVRIGGMCSLLALAWIAWCLVHPRQRTPPTP